MELLRTILSIIVSFLGLERLGDLGVFLFLKAVSALTVRLIWSIAVLVRHDEHTLDTEEWLDRHIYHIAQDEDDEDDDYEEDEEEEEDDEDDEEETGDEEYLQYGHVDDMDA